MHKNDVIELIEFLFNKKRGLMKNKTNVIDFASYFQTFCIASFYPPPDHSTPIQSLFSGDRRVLGLTLAKIDKRCSAAPLHSYGESMKKKSDLALIDNARCSPLHKQMSDLPLSLLFDAPCSTID